MKELDAYYDREADCWYVKVPFALPPSALTRVAAFIERINLERHRTTPHGDKRDHVARGLSALRAGRITQLVVQRGPVDVFASTERTKPERTFFS